MDMVGLRLMIITSFLLGATMILLSLSVSTISQSAALGSMGPLEWGLDVSIALTLIPSLITLSASGMMLVTMDLGPFVLAGKLRVVAQVRTFVALALTLILASFGSIFLASLGTESPWSWVFAAIGYAGSVAWLVVRGYYISRFVYSKKE
jgi:hypothetical protein